MSMSISGVSEYNKILQVSNTTQTNNVSIQGTTSQSYDTVEISEEGRKAAAGGNPPPPPPPPSSTMGETTETEEVDELTSLLESLEEDEIASLWETDDTEEAAIWNVQ